MLWLLAALALAGCMSRRAPYGPAEAAPSRTAEDFIMADGARLPVRVWPAAQAPWAIMLVLHGFNDSRDVGEYPAPAFADAGVTVFSFDQRGFGATPGRGLWPGIAPLVADARTAVALVHQAYPTLPLYVLGESMGGAVAMVLATSPDPPPVAGYILSAPAVWGRSQMSVLYRSGLYVAAHLAPGLALGSSDLPVKIRASDNAEALRRFSTDPLTIRRTRIDAVAGLTDLMDAALAAAPRLPPDSLILYGGHDALVPAHAMRAAWRSIGPGGPRLAYYQADYHLLLRDHERARPIDDVLAWMRHPAAPLPSGADLAAQAWLVQPAH